MTTNLTLGAGTILANFTPTATTKAALRRELAQAAGTHAIADTTGAGKFRAIPLTRNFYEEARRTPSADAQLLDGWKVTLSSHFHRVKPGAMETLLPWSHSDSVGKITTLSIPDAANGMQTIPQVAWVGETSQGLALIELRNAAHTGVLSLSFLPGDRGATPFELRAHSSGVDAPFTLTFLEN